MKKQAAAVLLAATMTFSLYGCGGAPPDDDGTQSDGALAREMFLNAQEELYDRDLKPAVKPYTVEQDFSNVINFSEFGNLSDKAKGMLLENGFVVMDGYNEEFFDLYESNRYSLIPNFVTTDSMMHSYHLFFSRLLKGIEKEHFCQDLIQLSQAMQEESLAQYTALKGTEWENAAKRNAGFFSVGLALLQEDTKIPAEVSSLAEQELSLINAASGITESPLMNLGGAESNPPLMEDYSQYIPRGYYTTSEELTRYFKAMMWYGRLSFRQNDEDQSRSALLMTMALEKSPALEQWKKIYSITSFFVGASDDPGIYEYAPVIRQAYDGMPSLEKLPDQKEQFKKYLKEISTLEPPEINSIPIYDKTIEANKDDAIRAFRFMGQRSTLDAAVFQQLIYREVGENSAGEKRMLPSALDIPSAIGSPTARELLRQAGAEDYADYSENMDDIRSYLADAPQTLWNGSLYNGWLNTLRPLTIEKGGGYPQFMQNRAWSAKGLNTFLGSWTELKHDTVLYAKQVYAEMGGGGDEENVDDRGYVEPEPVLYARLAGLARATADGLARFDVLRDSDGENLARMAELAQKLTVISEKELKDQLLDEEEYELIRSFGGQLEHFWYEALKDEKGGEEILSTDFPAAVVTDVATDPNGSVLEVGSGRIGDIYVIVNVDGRLRLAKGGVYTFYEFEQPLSERLTDEKWREMLGIDMSMDNDGNLIDRRVEIPHPEWTTLFRVPDET